MTKNGLYITMPKAKKPELGIHRSWKFIVIQLIFMNMEFDWKMYEFHEYEFHIPWICADMHNNFMKQMWILIWKLWICHEYEFKTHEWVHIINQNCKIMNMNTDANSWNMTNIIALAIHESHGLYEPRQCFSSSKKYICNCKGNQKNYVRI